MPSNKQYLSDVTNYVRQLEDLSKKEVVVGIPASANKNHKSEDGEIIKLAELGAIHEYGSPKLRIPQRSFLRIPLQTNHDRLLKFISKELSFSEIDTNNALGKLGALGQSVVLEAFKTQGDGKWKPLSPLTELYRKKGNSSGSSKPLIDTGQLRQSITFEVRNKE